MFTAREVANRIAIALEQSVLVVAIPNEDIPEDWNFDDIEVLALKG